MKIELNTVNKKAPSFALGVQTQQVIYAGFPRQYRADCEEGKFYIGYSEQVSEVLEIQPLRCKWFKQQRFSYEIDHWLDVAFIDSQRVLSVVSFRREGAANVAESLIKLAAGDGRRPILLESVRMTIGFERRESQEEILYFAPKVQEIEFVTESEFKIAQEFLAANSFPLPGEVTLS